MKKLSKKLCSAVLSVVLAAGFVSPTALAFATDDAETTSATVADSEITSDTSDETDSSDTSEEEADSPATSTPNAMYRLYNPNSGEQFFTPNTYERDNVENAGWCNEGVCWYAPTTSNTPVYRLYNSNVGAHHYTTSTAESDALVSVGWYYEGVGWYSDDAKEVPVYREYNPNYRMEPGAHSYTTNKDEDTLLVRLGWAQEGIAWYGTDVASDTSSSSESLSGQCGSGVSWEINSGGQLRVFGNGTLDAVSNKESWWYPYREQITSVVVEDGVIANADSSSLFAFLPNAKSIDISGLDTSNVTNMCRMFSCCNSLTSLDLSAFNTSNVTSMRWMFFDCFNLSSLDLSAFDTSDVTDMGMMFLRCLSLESVDVSTFDTSNVTNMSCMFDYSYLSELDLSSFDITNLVFEYNAAWYMMLGCYKLSLVTLPAEGDFSGLLPTPNSEFITGATGIWVNTKGETFTSDEIPENVADTYAAAGSAAAAEFPENPGIVDEPDEPVEPIEPDEPEEPVEPDEPDVPVEPEEPIEPDTPDEPVEADIPAADDSDFNGGINFPDDDANKKFHEFIDDKGEWHFVLDKHGDMDEKKREAIDKDIVAPNRKVAEELDIFIQGEKERIGLPEELDIWITIRIKMTDSMMKLKPDTIVVFYVSDDGTVELMTTQVEGDYVTFMTKHFSTYVVAGEEQIDKFVGDQPGDDPISDQPSEQPGADQPSEEPSENPAGDQPGDEPTGEEPGNDPSSEQPSDNPTGEEPSGEQGGTPTGDSTQTVATVTMFRLYNQNSGEHFYTANAGEKSNLVSLGWSDEGTGWIAPATGDPVYRLYNPNAGEHHYTTNASEKAMLEQAGWQYEGVGWYSGGDVRLYREYNPNAYANNHNYTTNKGEHDWLLSLGWNDEGFAWNAVAAR